MFVSIFPQIVTTLAITKAKDQIRPELKRLDPEITLELTDIRFQNDYSTLALRASGKCLQHRLCVEFHVALICARSGCVRRARDARALYWPSRDRESGPVGGVVRPANNV